MKAVKMWSIVTLIFSILCFGLLVLCIVRPAEFGNWMVVTYEDITCDLGHTATGAYNVLTKVSIISFSILFVINQILHFSCSSKVKKSGINIKNEINNNGDATMLKRIKKQKEEKVKKEKKVRIKKEKIEEISEPVVEKNNPEVRDLNTNQKLANFLDSFR